MLLRPAERRLTQRTTSVLSATKASAQIRSSNRLRRSSGKTADTRIFGCWTLRIPTVRAKGFITLQSLRILTNIIRERPKRVRNKEVLRPTGSP